MTTEGHHVALLAVCIQYQRIFSREYKMFRRIMRYNVVIDIIRRLNDGEIGVYDIPDSMVNDVYKHIMHPLTLTVSADEQKEVLLNSTENIMDAMGVLIEKVLPGAIIKYEFGVKLDVVENVVVNKLMPKISDHPLWIVHEIHAKRIAINIFTCRCRRCGKHTEHVHCKKCKFVKYCSVECLKADLADEIFGHHIDCTIF